MSSIRATELAAGAAGADLLVLGPSLGTSVAALWEDVVGVLGDRFRIIGWDLPGHGASPEPDGPVSFAELGDSVAAIARDAERAWYAGVSAGAAAGLQALLDSPGTFSGAVLCSTGARIGVASAWLERADVVDKLGTPSQVEASARRWFAPGFIESHPQVVTRLLATLQTAGPVGYSAVCRALAEFDVRDRLGAVDVPVLAVAGEHDQPTPVSDLAFIAANVPHGRLTVLDGVAHLAPAEAPDAVATAIVSLASSGLGEAFSQGMSVRREVLGADHVAAATERATALTAPFQQYITETAWGSIWSRPGLDRRTRSVVTLTALVAGHHWNELAMHVRAARRNGLTDVEIREILLQCAVYCSVPSANHALAIAAEVFAEGGPDLG